MKKKTTTKEPSWVRNGKRRGMADRRGMARVLVRDNMVIPASHFFSFTLKVTLSQMSDGWFVQSQVRTALGPGLDPLIGKCLGPHALEGPAGAFKGLFNAQIYLLIYWEKFCTERNQAKKGRTQKSS